MVRVAECRFDLPENLDPRRAKKKHRLTRSLREWLLADLDVDDPLVEEYTILILRKPARAPDGFDESIHSRMALTWGREFNSARLVGWMMLLIGYVILFILEL